MRKITSITKYQGSLIALCDDGTVWRCAASRLQWAQLPEIPQETAPEKVKSGRIDSARRLRGDWTTGASGGNYLGGVGSLGGCIAGEQDTAANLTKLREDEND